jgi:hypothetical protein
MPSPKRMFGFKRKVWPYAWSLFILIGLSSCVRHSEYQHEGASYLQGVWQQQPSAYEDELLHSTLHEFTFRCDSMYTVMHQRSKSIKSTDTCFGDGQWTEYAKAVYVVRGDSLIADGVYAKDNWKQKVSGCHRIGQYLPRFKIEYYSEDSLVLSNRFDTRRIELKKTQDITCVPRKRFE